MPQTFLALLGLGLLSLVALRQHQAIQASERSLVRNEVTTMVSGKLVEALDGYESRTVAQLGGLPATEHVRIAALADTLRFVVNAETQRVARQAEVWRADPAGPCLAVRLRATGPTGAAAEFRLPTDAAGRGLVTLARVYCD